MSVESLTAKQRASILEATRSLNIWSGAVRSGKTVASYVAWLRFIRSGPEGPLLMSGKTLRSMKRNILDPMVEFIGASRMHVNMGRGEAEILGRKVYLVGANDERSETKIRGITLAGAYGDELTTWPESYFKMLLTRLSIRGSKLFGTTNPDTPLHWLKRGFIDRKDVLDMASFEFHLDDNTFLDADIIERIKAENTGLWYKRFVLGMWVGATGSIYDAFDTDRHLVDAVPEGVSIGIRFIGIDYGTSNPFVALLIGKGSDGRFYVLSEWRWSSADAGRQKSDDEYAAGVVDWLRPLGATSVTCYCDPSAASFIVSARQHGLSVVPANNDVIDGIRTVASLIAGDKLRIVRSGPVVLPDELISYAWDEKKQEKGEDAPVKKDDHGPDALRYALYTRVSTVASSFFEEAAENNRLRAAANG